MKYADWFDKYYDKLVEEYGRSSSNDWTGFVNNSYEQYKNSKGE